MIAIARNADIMSSICIIFRIVSHAIPYVEPSKLSLIFKKFEKYLAKSLMVSIPHLEFHLLGNKKINHNNYHSNEPPVLNRCRAPKPAFLKSEKWSEWFSIFCTQHVPVSLRSIFEGRFQTTTESSLGLLWWSRLFINMSIRWWIPLIYTNALDWLLRQVCRFEWPLKRAPLRGANI